MSDTTTPPAPSAWKSFSGGVVRVFRGYANWLVGITWKRFFVLSILLVILSAILQNVPPFTWTVGDEVERTVGSRLPKIPSVPKIHIEKPNSSANSKDDDVVISIDKDSVRIAPRRPAAAATQASAAEGSARPGDGTRAR
jgi:hypothetical protein